MLTASAYDTHVEQLLDRIRQLHELLSAARIPYRIVGGMAVFIHVFERDPVRARLTADVDAAIGRGDLPAVIEAARRVGWSYRHVAGVAAVSDLVRMKLTSFRLKDRVHIQDLDAVGLMTAEMEERLPELLRARLAEIGACE